MSQPPPEILAPVGTLEMAQAAVHNGAGAVYLGLPEWNARGRSKDFSVAELKEIVDFCHLYGVRVFLACNILIFERELATIEETLRDILPLGIDALIVQDIGLVRLIKKLAPDQVIHASTQMTVTNHEAIELTEDLGIKRYVLGRENSISEIERIRQATSKELEVFVHGALCVAYSGQCLTSESQGGRSANRGQCAQSCRLPYQLIVDGKEKELGKKRHLVSPQDLCGLEDVPRLIAAGVNSFKIEGRLKSPEYVASAVKNYHDACTAAEAGNKLPALQTRLNELALTFSRGQFNGWLDGVNHQKLVDGRYSKPTGIFLGKVTAINREFIEINSTHEVSPGDGIMLSDFSKQINLGGIVLAVRRLKSDIFSLMVNEELPLSRVSIGMEVFQNASSTTDRALRQSFTNKEKLKKIPLSCTISGTVNSPLVVTIADDQNHTITVQSKTNLLAAKSAPLTEDSALAELNALSATPFFIADNTFLITDQVFIHNRELKEIRREFVSQLSTLRTSLLPNPLASGDTVQQWKSSLRSRVETTSESSSFNVLIRDEQQLSALSNQAISWVYLDFEFNKEYEHALQKVRALGFKCAIATTRILKPGELGHLKYIERLKPDAILVRNLGALHYFQNKQIPLFGDFSLNIANSLSADYFLGKGLSTYCPSYDLNQAQLMDLLNQVNPAQVEATIHQYMPAFHMEHCVYAAFLSSGSSYRDCGRPCEKHRVELRDPSGILHPLKPDAECRNTMFQGRPQSAARLIPELRKKGVRSFRLEALFETADELMQKISAYAEVVHGRAEPESIFGTLGIIERYGVTEGQLFNDAVYKDKKKESLAIL